MAKKSTSLSSIGDLLRAEGFSASVEPEPAVELAPAPTLQFAPKIVLRRERKGRGGKTVTTVTGISGEKELLSNFIRDLKRRLGCGGRLDGEVIVFQGDCREELAALLEAKGVKGLILS